MKINQSASYIEAQTLQVAPLPILDGSNGQFKIQVRSDRGQTKWINITAEQYRWIEYVLQGRDLELKAG